MGNGKRDMTDPAARDPNCKCRPDHDYDDPTCGAHKRTGLNDGVPLPVGIHKKIERDLNRMELGDQERAEKARAKMARQIVEIMLADIRRCGLARIERDDLEAAVANYLDGCDLGGMEARVDGPDRHSMRCACDMENGLAALCEYHAELVGEAVQQAVQQDRDARNPDVALSTPDQAGQHPDDIVEMTLDQAVDWLPETHRARVELDGLRDEVDMVGAINHRAERVRVAGWALEALIINVHMRRTDDPHTDAQKLADDALYYADALIARIDKTEPETD